VTLLRGRRGEERSESTPFALRPEVADACLTRLGVRAPVEMTDVAAVVDRFAETFPRGSTAKLDAIAAGQMPPGSDPDLVAERWLARRVGRAGVQAVAVMGTRGELFDRLAAAGRSVGRRVDQPADDE
jgi:hypothetical protein